MWFKYSSVRSQKQLLRHRIALVQDRTRMSNMAGRLLTSMTLHCVVRWAEAVNLRMLEAASLANADDDYVLYHIIRQIRQVNEEIADVNKRIRTMALENKTLGSWA